MFNSSSYSNSNYSFHVFMFARGFSEALALHVGACSGCYGTPGAYELIRDAVAIFPESVGGLHNSG